MAEREQFDRQIPIQNIGRTKWETDSGMDIIQLGIADMDFPSPKEVVEALKWRAEIGLFGYTKAPEGLSDLVSERLARLYDWKIKPDWIVYTSGTVPSLYAANRAIGEPNDSIISLTPIYPPFLKAPEKSGKRLITVPMINTQNQWNIDFESLENAIEENTKLLVFCNPHNPLGRVYSKEELEQIADICKRKNLVICSDEVFSELILDEDKRHLPIASLDDEISSRSITLMSPSKTFNTSGLKFSFAIIPDPEVRKRFTEEMKEVTPGMNPMGPVAAMAAYLYGEDWKRGLLDYLRENRDIVYKYVAETPGISVNPIEATYLAWIDVSSLNNLHDPTSFFLEKAGVRILDGKEFQGEGFIRLNFATQQQTLIKAMEQIKSAVTAHTQTFNQNP